MTFSSLLPPPFNVRRFFGKEPYSSFQHIQGGQYPYHLGTAEIRAEEKKSSLLDEGWVGEEGARGSWAGVARSSQGCYSLLISDYVFLTSPPELSQEAYTLLKLDLRFFESTCGTTNTPCSSASLLRSAPPLLRPPLPPTTTSLWTRLHRLGKYIITKTFTSKIRGIKLT